MIRGLQCSSKQKAAGLPNNLAESVVKIQVQIQLHRPCRSLLLTKNACTPF